MRDRVCHRIELWHGIKVSDSDVRLRWSHADRNGVSAALRSPVLRIDAALRGVYPQLAAAAVGSPRR